MHVNLISERAQSYRLALRRDLFWQLIEARAQNKTERLAIYHRRRRWRRRRRRVVAARNEIRSLIVDLHIWSIAASPGKLTFDATAM